MTHRQWTGTGMVSLLALAGCQQGPPKGMDMSEIMKLPPRAAELDRLDAFVGTWEGTADMKLMGETIQSTGTYRVKWDCDRRMLLEHWEADMGKGDRMCGIGLWTWDPKIGKYRTYYFDNYGTKATGTSTYDAPARTWHMKTKGSGPMGDSVGEGSVKMLDDNTMEWTFTEWNAWKTQKVMEGKGVSRRSTTATGG